MKKYLYLLIIPLFFLACTQEELILDDIKPPAIISPQDGTNYSLGINVANEVLAVMEWEAANFGVPVAITYTVQFSTSNDFLLIANLKNTNSNSMEILVSDLNTILTTQLGINDTTMHSQIYCRIRAMVNENVDTLFSETISLNIQPYIVEVGYPEIYVCGSFQGWDAGSAPALVSGKFDEKYEGYIFIKEAAEFKFLKEQNWDLNWGDNETDGTLELGGGNISVPEEGYYKINVDLFSMTYNILKTNWGLIGSATEFGWSNTQDMVYNTEEGIWAITDDFLAGDIKFIANNSWDINYGDNEADEILDLGGSNIPIETAGNYTINLNLGSYPYSYSIIKN